MTVTGNDDAAAATVALSHSAAGGDYTTVTVYSVEVKLLATPATPVIHAGLTISKLDLKVPEGGSESYSFVLKHKPSADVSMAVSLPTGNDLSIDETSLTFTPDDWATAQSITVSAAQDDDGATDAEVTITHTISGGQYDDLPMPDVGVTITENDTPGVALSKTSLTVDEGGTGTHTVVLDTKPSQDVTVTVVDPTDNTDVTASPASLTLTKDNWSTAQTVTVSAAQDQCPQDTDHLDDTATVTHATASTDTACEALTVDSVAATVTDDEDTPVKVSFGAAACTAAEGGTAAIEVSLDQDPERRVEIPLSVTGQGGTSSEDCSGVPASVTCNSGDTDEEFTFTAAADEIDDDGESVKLTFGTPPTAVTEGTTDETVVSITDDDTAGVKVNPTRISVIAGRNYTYTAVLQSEPTANVTIAVSAPADAEISLDKTTMTFTPLDWEAPDCIDVTADDDAQTATVTLTHSISGGGDDSVSVADVRVKIKAAPDNPAIQADVTTSETALEMPEGGSKSHSVLLGHQPAGDVTLAATLPTGNDLSIDKTSLTFTEDDWDTAHSIGVSAAEDDDGDDDAKVTIAHAISGGGYDDVTVPGAAVTIKENDTPGGPSPRPPSRLMREGTPPTR